MSCTSNSETTESGFSLLEVSIVLVVLGIVGALSLPLLTQSLQRTALVKTKERMNLSMDALAAYVERHGRFPCPADPSLKGDSLGKTSINATCMGKTAEGILPFRSMGLSESDVKDGYNHYFTYAVEPELAKPQPSLSEEDGGHLSVLTADGLPVLDDRYEKDGEFIAVVLISHGESGIGAFKGNGQKGKIEGEGASAFKTPLHYQEPADMNQRMMWETRDVFLKHRVKQ